MRHIIYVYEREFTVREFEMMRAAGAKAVASVEMAVPPTMVAGELNAEISEGETSGEWRGFQRRRLRIRTSTNNHTEWFQSSKPRDEWVNAGKQSSKYLYM
jgi:hypothetical protein